MNRLAPSLVIMVCLCLPALCQNNVLSFGALCNGSNNDATAIQNAINATATAGGVVYFPAGVCVSGSTITLPSGVILKGFGRFVTKIQASASLASSGALVQTANFGGSGCNASGYASCPSEFGVEDMTLDGNGYTVGPRGTATSGAVLSIRGNRYLIHNVDVVNSPYDGIYSEMAGGVASPPFSGVSCSGSPVYCNYGNAASYDAVRPNNNANNGLTFYGPPDSQFNQLIPFYNGNYGAIFGCINGGCGTNAYLTDFHAWHNSSWGLEVETLLQGSDVQSESNQGGGIRIAMPATPTGDDNYGTVLFSNVQTWHNDGDGLNCQSPNLSYAYIVGYYPTVVEPYFNNIQGIQSWSNAGWGLNATTNCTRAAVTNPTLTYNSAGGMYWPVRETQIDNLVSKLNTGNGLDLSGINGFGYMRITGVSEGNTGTQLAYPSGATTSNGSVLQLSISVPSGGTNITGIQPTDLTAQISEAEAVASSYINFAAGIGSNGAPATFATLPSSPNNGDMIYCEDCTVTTPASCMNVATAAACTCTSGGTGAYAKRVNGTWLCN